MPEYGRKPLGVAPKIAIGAASVAVLMSLLAVIVVMSRGGGDAPAVAAGSASEAAPKVKPKPEPSDPPPEEIKQVAASDVVRLRREVVTPAYNAGKMIGVKVTDDELRRALDLRRDDVITAISGRTIEREFDVFEAMLGVKRLRASTVFVELLRGGKPVLVRWKLDDDLQMARAPDPLGGSLGSLGGNPGGPGGPLVGDPLADTIQRIDDLHYEVPRATVERVFASRSTYARVARTMPSHRTAGFLVYSVRPGTLVAAIGISNGDAIRAINGNAVSSIDEVVDLYPQIKDAAEWRIDVDRRNKPVLITIAIK
jgi:type II secretory pathway component PulC